MIYHPSQVHDPNSSKFIMFKKFSIKQRTHIKISLLKQFQFSRAKIIIISDDGSYNENNYKTIDYNKLQDLHSILYISDPHEFRTILDINDIVPGN